MNVILNGKKIKARKGVKISYLIKNHHFYYKAVLNNELVDLDTKIYEDSEIILLDLKNDVVMRCYEATLRFVFLYALHELNMSLDVRFNYTISRALFVYIKDGINCSYIIEEKMRDIINHGYEIKRLEDGYYEINGFKKWMNNDLLNNTSMVRRFKLFPIHPGIIIQFPRSELNGNIPLLSDSLKYFNSLNESLLYVINNGIDTIYKLNKALENKDLILKLESNFKEKINKITDDIINDNKRVVLITGPSSSGKTTLASLVQKSLREKNKKILLISIDDYYKNRDEVPKKDGIPDFECYDAFYYEELNNDLKSLINNKQTVLKKYDFLTGLSNDGESVKIDSDTIIILEGIHALNDRFSYSIDRNLKYKIFISPQCLINIDSYNPIVISDIRLLRRSIRDYKHRATTFNQTLEMWSNVRLGEYKYIYPCQDDSDYTLNTFMPYELNVIKNQALPLLNDFEGKKSYFRIKNIKKVLNMLDTIDESCVPEDSIINEFIK